MLKKILSTLKRIVKGICIFVVWMLARLCRGRKNCPTKMELARFLRQGIFRVGKLWPIPTRKSWRVWKILHGAQSIRIFMTVPENWGGGAVYYLDRQIAGFEKGCISLLVAPAGENRWLAVRMYDGSELVERFYVSSLDALKRLPHKVVELVVSTVIGWQEVIGQRLLDHTGIAELMGQFLDLKHSLKCRMLYLLHDYFCICPRMFLINTEGAYCGAEITGVKCNACCAKEANCECHLVAGGTDVLAWRKTMADFFAETEEIRAFSQDTVSRMKQIFPQFSYTLEPHSEPDTIKRKPDVKYDVLRVGVIGEMHQNKGAQVLCNLASWLSIHHQQQRITLIGDWYAPISRPANIDITGRYSQGELPDFVERTGVNIVLFSSTVPETFSYIMHEIIQMELPVVCFDRGAQKDCAEAYEKGRVAHSTEPEVVWNAICSLFEEMRLPQRF